MCLLDSISSQTETINLLERSISKITLKDQLPTYKAYDPETNSVVDRTAVFDPVRNSDWIYDETQKPFRILDNILVSTGVWYTDIILQFPGADKEGIVNTIPGGIDTV